MKPIYIFRHIDIEGPGMLGEHLALRQLPSRLIKIDEGEALPSDTRDMSGLILLGGPMSVNEPHEWIAQELELIREAAANRLPVLGHCLGGQLISKALGGTISANATKEIGWFEVACEAPSWCDRLPRHFSAFHWHGEIFTVPSGATSLFASDHCPQQGFAYDRMLALQFHLEITATMLPQWCQRYHEELATCTGLASVQTAEQMIAGLKQHLGAMRRHAGILYDHWLHQGELLQE